MEISIKAEEMIRLFRLSASCCFGCRSCRSRSNRQVSSGGHTIPFERLRYVLPGWYSSGSEPDAQLKIEDCGNCLRLYVFDKDKVRVPELGFELRATGNKTIFHLGEVPELSPIAKQVSGRKSLPLMALRSQLRGDSVDDEGKIAEGDFSNGDSIMLDTNDIGEIVKLWGPSNTIYTKIIADKHSGGSGSLACLTNFIDNQVSRDLWYPKFVHVLVPRGSGRTLGEDYDDPRAFVSSLLLLLLLLLFFFFF